MQSEAIKYQVALMQQQLKRHKKTMFTSNPRSLVHATYSVMVGALLYRIKEVYKLSNHVDPRNIGST